MAPPEPAHQPLPPPTGDATADPDAREWAIVECLDAARDELGRPGQHKVPVTDLAALYTRAEAWEALGAWQEKHPEREFSMRRMTNVGPALAAALEPTDTDGPDR